MLGLIMRTVHMIMTGAILYVVIMTNQKKTVDFPKGMATDELASSIPDDASHSSGDGGENLLGSKLRMGMGHSMNSFRPSASHLMAKNRSNLKSQ